MAVKTSWAAGDVLTAADLTDTVQSKANLASPTFTGTVALPATTTLNGSTLRSAKILQVAFASYATATTTTSTTPVDSGLSISFTPISSTSNLLVMAFVQGIRLTASNSSAAVGLRLNRDTTEIQYFAATLGYTASAVSQTQAASTSHWEAASSTSARTYKVRFFSYAAGNSVTVQNDSMTSSIVVMEVTA